MPAYRYTVAQQGESFGLNKRTRETVRHTDTLAVTASVMPSGVELGLFGDTIGSDHQFGKPTNGGHLSVEGNSLNGNDQIYTNDTAWVSGAMCFNLGTLAPGAMASLELLLSVHTTYAVVHPPFDLVIRGFQRNGKKMLNLDFEETTGNPYLSFVLRKTTDVSAELSTWQQVPIPYFIGSPRPGWNRFMIPFDPTEPQAHFVIEPHVVP
jgi:hypothetical protein